MACWELANDMSKKEQRCTTLANYFTYMAGSLTASRSERWEDSETRSASSCIRPFLICAWRMFPDTRR